MRSGEPPGRLEQQSPPEPMSGFSRLSWAALPAKSPAHLCQDTAGSSPACAIPWCLPWASQGLHSCLQGVCASHQVLARFCYCRVYTSMASSPAAVNRGMKEG